LLEHFRFFLCLNVFMLISFRGRGWMVGIVSIVSLLLADLLSGLQFHDSSYYARHGWPKLAAFWFAAGVVRWLLPAQQDEVIPGSQTVSEKKVALKERDSFLLLPVKFWPIVLLALGVVFYFVRD